MSPRKARPQPLHLDDVYRVGDETSADHSPSLLNPSTARYPQRSSSLRYSPGSAPGTPSGSPTSADPFINSRLLLSSSAAKGDLSTVNESDEGAHEHEEDDDVEEVETPRERVRDSFFGASELSPGTFVFGSIQQRPASPIRRQSPIKHTAPQLSSSGPPQELPTPAPAKFPLRKSSLPSLHPTLISPPATSERASFSAGLTGQPTTELLVPTVYSRTGDRKYSVSSALALQGSSEDLLRPRGHTGPAVKKTPTSSIKSADSPAVAARVASFEQLKPTVSSPPARAQPQLRSANSSYRLHGASIEQHQDTVYTPSQAKQKQPVSRTAPSSPEAPAEPIPLLQPTVYAPLKRKDKQSATTSEASKELLQPAVYVPPTSNKPRSKKKMSSNTTKPQATTEAKATASSSSTQPPAVAADPPKFTAGLAPGVDPKLVRPDNWTNENEKEFQKALEGCKIWHVEQHRMTVGARIKMQRIAKKQKELDQLKEERETLEKVLKGMIRQIEDGGLTMSDEQRAEVEEYLTPRELKRLRDALD